LEIPGTLYDSGNDDYVSVSAIAPNAFKTNAEIFNGRSITFPSSLYSIGASAFNKIGVGPSSIIFTNHMTYDGNDDVSIGSGAFQQSAITTITVGNNIDLTISDGAFYNCASLTTFTTAGHSTYIGSYAFNNCANLTSITLSKINVADQDNGTITIGSYAFQYCAKLIDVNFT
jgi:hypothetical protein